MYFEKCVDPDQLTSEKPADQDPQFSTLLGILQVIFFKITRDGQQLKMLLSID